MILESKGWTELSRIGRRGEDGPVGALRGTSPQGRKGQIAPNPLRSLNAMHEAVKVLDYEQAEQFESELWAIVCEAEHEKDNPPPTNFACMNAESEQRCEAFIRAIGKWETTSSEVGE